MTKLKNNLFFALLPLLIISFVSNVVPYIYIPSLPEIANYFKISEAQTTSTISIYYFVFSITLLIVGIVGDVWNKKHLLLGACLTIFTGTLFAGFTSNFYILLFGWALQAVGAAIILVIGQTWIGQSSTKNNITSLFSYFTIFLSFAPLIAPIMGGFINDGFNNWRYNFYLTSVLSLIALVFINGINPPNPILQKVPLRKVASDYYQLLFKSNFLGLIGTSLACFFFQGAIMTYSSFLFTKQLGIKPSLYGFISVPAILGILIGQFPTIYIEKKKGIIKAHLFNCIVAMSALGGSLIYYLIEGKHSVVELALVILVYNIGFGGHSLLAISRVMSIFKEQRSYSSALLNFSNQSVAYLASVIVQLLFLFFGSAMEIHNYVSILTILFILISIPLFRKNISSL